MSSQTISHYRIITKLGAGGMGEVFLAEDTHLGRKVAIKLLPAGSTEDTVAKKRLINEARAAAKLDHPNICSIYDVNEEGDLAFIVMQYIQGRTLSSILKTQRLELDDAVDIASQVAEALAEAHSRGIVHRDIKPQNIIITRGRQAKVLDFGLAKITRERTPLDSEADTSTLLTEAGTAVGTVPYMSPEQVKGQEVDARSDLFSLGVLLYESVAGRLPFSGSNKIEICSNVIHVDPPPPSQLNPRVPPDLDRLTLKALAKAPHTRYQSAAEMVADFRKLREGLRSAEEATTAILGTRPEPLRKRLASLLGFLRKRTIAVALAIVMVALILTVWAITPRGPHQPQPEAAVWYQRGTAFLRDGAYYQASKELERAVQLDDRFVLAHARLAEAYAETDYTDKSMHELLVATLYRSELDQRDATYLDAIRFTVLRDFARAIESYHQLADQATDFEESSVWVDIGRAYEKSENLDKAVESYLEATRRDQESATAFLRLAVLYGRKQNLEGAIEAFDKAEQIYRLSFNQEGVTEVLYQRGVLHNNIDKLADARKLFEDALERARISNSTYQQIKALLQLSSIYYYGESDTERAREYATDAIEMARANNMHNLEANGLIDLGAILLSRGEHDDAERCFTQALDFAEGKMGRIEARARLALADLKLQRDQPDQAIDYCRQALAFYEPAGYRKETSISLNMLASANQKKGDYEGAIKGFEQQLQLAEEMGDPSQTAASHLQIGVLLGVEMERYPEGLRHLDESYRINNSLGATYNAGYDLMIRGRLLWQLGRYDEAKTVLSRALTIANRPESSYKHLHAWVILSQGQMALSQGRLAQANTKAQQALDSAGTLYGDIAIQARCVLGVARAFSGAPLVGKALCQEAVRTATERKNARELSSALLALAEVTLMAGDPVNALTTALQAQSMLTRSSQEDSEWHAWLIAARASQLAGNKAQVSEYSSRAANLLSTLRQEWGVVTFDRYSDRPDITACRKQLDQILRD